MNKHFFSLYFLLLVSCIAFGQGPTGFSGTGYRTTVHLKWDPYTAFTPAGYNIYRHTQGSVYGAPVRRIGAYEDYTDYGLVQGTQYFYRITAFDAAGNESPLSFEVPVQTTNNTYRKVANLDVLVPIYTGGMTASAPNEIMGDLEFARQFYFRNTFGQLNLKFHFWIIPGYPPPNANGLADFATIEADLKSKGVLDNQYDAVYIEAMNLYGFYGGAWWFGQTAGSMGYDWTHWDALDRYTQGNAWLFTHEFGHALDFVMANGSGYPEMLFNHFGGNFPLPPEIPVFDAGDGFDGMAIILRLFNHHLDYAAPWDGYFEVQDSDGDGLADNDPRLVVDELRFGSNANLADTDNDGLKDLEEYYAGTFSSANPNDMDTDDDGLKDGVDPYPVSNFASQNPKSTTPISIDGVMSAGEDWHPMVSKPFFSNVQGATLSTFTTWDDNNFYFAFQSSHPLKYFLQMDGSGEDGMHSTDIRFPTGDYSSVNDNSFGDSYYVYGELIIRSDGSQVYLKEQPVAGSQVSTTYSNGIYTTEVKLPHNIGPGHGNVYSPPTAPVVTTQSYHEGDIIGIGLIALQLGESNGNTAIEWTGYYVSKHVILMNDYLHNYDMELTAGVSNNYCASTSNFPWEDWIAKVKLGAINNASGKSPYSDFTALSTNLSTGSTPIELTTGFSYFTWDEYWRVWVDLNHDGDFTDAGETVYEGIKTKPSNGTPTATLSSNIFIPTSAMTGPTRMRVSMKRGAYATPCETLAFGEVEDYTVNIGIPPQFPNLVVPNYEVIPGLSQCYANPGGPFGYFAGIVLNSGSVPSGAFKMKVTVSKDDQPSANDVFWQEFQYTGLIPNNTAGFNLNNPVPASLTPGKYFVLLQIDPENQVNETNETDNLIKVGVSLGAPDFTLSNVSGMPTSAVPGTALNISAEVTNISPFPLTELQGSLTVKAYLSTNNQFSTADDIEIGTATLAYSQFTNGPLYNGGKASTVINAQVPGNTLSGSYYVFVVVSQYCEVSMANNVSSAVALQVTTGGTPGSYCASKSNFPWEDWIGRVKINDLDNPSGKSTYSDFTSKTVHLKQGLQYSSILTTAYSYFTFDEYWRVWVDLNQNGIFENDEAVLQAILQRPGNGTTNASVTQTLVIPSNALVGTTRMRVSMKRDAWPSPCETLPYGEVEDYTVEIQPAATNLPNLFPSYSGVPVSGHAGEILAGEFAILNNGTVPVSGSYTVKWFFSYDNAIGPDDELMGSATLSNTPVGVTPVTPVNVTVPTWAQPGTYYVFMVVDKENQVAEINEFDNLASNQFTVLGTGGGGGSYCASVSAFPWHEWISSVKINDLEVTSGKSTYSDFTATTFTLNKNSSTNTVKFTGSYSYFVYPEYWMSWVDFNHNGVFEPSERLFEGNAATLPPDGSNATQSISGKVGPFPNALTGPTRMRVSMKRNTAASPCEELPFGEVEDFTVFISDNANDPGTENRAANIYFEANPEKTWVNLAGAYHFAEPVAQVEVEKSLDGNDYEVLETVQGKAIADNSQVLQVVDRQPNDGFNYYRMLILLANGEEVYGPVRIVAYNELLDYTIFPNPATSEVFIQVMEAPESEMNWNINDAYGRVVWTQKIAPDAQFPYRIDVTGLRDGLYYLFAQQPGRRAVGKRFVVVR